MKGIISVLVLMLAGCSGPVSERKDGPSPDMQNAIPATAIREKFSDNPGLENVIVNDEAGVLVMQGTLLNGKKEGVWTEFYSTGSVKSVTPYINGKKEGMYIEINSSSQFVKRISFHNDLRHGPYVEYTYPTKKEERAYINGKLEGSVKVYYPDGKIMEEGSYKNDTRDGTSRWFDNEGKVTIEYEYTHGELVKK